MNGMHKNRVKSLFILVYFYASTHLLSSRVVSVLDSGAEGLGSNRSHGTVG